MKQLVDTAILIDFSFPVNIFIGIFLGKLIIFKQLQKRRWRIDYFITSKRLDNKLEKAAIHTELYGSDHCPIELQINIDELLCQQCVYQRVHLCLGIRIQRRSDGNGRV